MTFLLTDYIYPLQEKLILSDKYKFSLDNPRTTEEIDLVVNYIIKSYNFELGSEYLDGGIRIPINDGFREEEEPEFMTIESSLSYFFKNYGEVDFFVKDFAERNKSNNPFEVIGKMWVIARYDDEGERERLNQKFEQIKSDDPGGKYLAILKDSNPLISNSKRLLDYSYILSFLYHTDDEHYQHSTFIIQKYYDDLSRFKIDRKINQCIIMFAFKSFSSECHHEEDRWNSFYHIKDDIIRISGQLDSLFKNDMEEKILYVADILRVIGEEMNDQRQILLTLTGLMELLITHSPDHSRFNVEDSISKQFKLKASVLIYLNNKSLDIKQVKNRLGEIYNQRSNIAHGNFETLKKYVNKELLILQKTDPDAEESYVLEYLNRDLRIYLKAILEEIIKDRSLVNFIKEN